MVQRLGPWNSLYWLTCCLLAWRTKGECARWQQQFIYGHFSSYHSFQVECGQLECSRALNVRAISDWLIVNILAIPVHGTVFTLWLLFVCLPHGVPRMMMGRRGWTNKQTNLNQHSTLNSLGPENSHQKSMSWVLFCVALQRLWTFLKHVICQEFKTNIEFEWYFSDGKSRKQTSDLLKLVPLVMVINQRDWQHTNSLSHTNTANHHSKCYDTKSLFNITSRASSPFGNLRKCSQSDLHSVCLACVFPFFCFFFFPLPHHLVERGDRRGTNKLWQI